MWNSLTFHSYAQYCYFLKSNLNLAILQALLRQGVELTAQTNCIGKRIQADEDVRREDWVTTKRSDEDNVAAINDDQSSDDTPRLLILPIQEKDQNVSVYVLRYYVWWICIANLSLGVFKVDDQICALHWFCCRCCSFSGNHIEGRPKFEQGFAYIGTFFARPIFEL